MAGSGRGPQLGDTGRCRPRYLETCFLRREGGCVHDRRSTSLHRKCNSVSLVSTQRLMTKTTHFQKKRKKNSPMEHFPSLVAQRTPSGVRIGPDVPLASPSPPEARALVRAVSCWHRAGVLLASRWHPAGIALASCWRPAGTGQRRRVLALPCGCTEG